ncbi:dehydrogenase/reductase SDR family member 8 precursor [Westerdykella ornata]|uniref:Short-chain dehydrogenase/reductase 3 n=1 Tax=Westerdykella ornata TaxID=318751 RepID=A0A6A6J6W5_WESOR|nr:dehydrogenase/reductase SDR family member 8 precursor [Westerdykella ornata]KAF2271376.1 dehydrogenase/reductase SDR family member 8 precursor [Westerdykella ornata]
MPIRSEWQLAREGVTGDTLARALRHTVLNPLFTVPLLLAARYHPEGSRLAAGNPGLYRYLKIAAGLGVLQWVREWLDNGVTNNWVNDRYDWSKEVVVVTGGSDGIGRIVVERLAERGVKVAVLDVQGLTYEAPPTVRYFHVDLASKPSIEKVCAQVKATLGNPTVLINNAGAARGKSILDSTEKDIKLTFNVNALSHYFLVQQFLPSMIERNHGMIVTVASMAAYVAAPNMVDYAASKAAALAFHEGLSAELATVYKAPRIRTVLMAQGYTRTKLFEGFQGRALYPETVADEIVRAVFAGKSKHIILPESGWLLVPRIRSLPLFMQYGLRKRLVKLMSRWQGRQVVQPSLDKGEEVERKVEESAVLVSEGQ